MLSVVAGFPQQLRTNSSILYVMHLFILTI